MSTNSARSGPGARQKKVIKGFDLAKLRAPFVLRCGALMIDYIAVLIVPVSSLLLGRFWNYDGSKLLNSELNSAGWLIAILLALTNFFIFPMISGQSIGKMVTGLKIVRVDGSTPGFTAIFVRHLAGYPLSAIIGMIGFLMAMFDSGGRALHDYIAGTVVVYASPKVKMRTKVIQKRKFSSTQKNTSAAESASAGTKI